MIKVLTVLLLSIASQALLTSCTTPNKNQALSPDSYFNLIKLNTRKSEKYIGLNNQYIVHITYLKSGVQTAQNLQLKKYLDWGDKKTAKNRRALFKTMSEKSQFFLSFYTPKKELKNLHRGDSFWNFYLEIDGRRYPGKLLQKRKLKAQTRSLFPYHTRWSRSYYLNFNIPTLTTEEKDFKIIMSSSAGKSTFNF